MISTVALGEMERAKAKVKEQGQTYTYVIALKIKRAKENTYARENWGGCMTFVQFLLSYK